MRWEERHCYRFCKKHALFGSYIVEGNNAASPGDVLAAQESADDIPNSALQLVEISWTTFLHCEKSVGQFSLLLRRSLDRVILPSNLFPVALSLSSVLRTHIRGVKLSVRRLCSFLELLSWWFFTLMFVKEILGSFLEICKIPMWHQIFADKGQKDEDQAAGSTTNVSLGDLRLWYNEFGMSSNIIGCLQDTHRKNAENRRHHKWTTCGRIDSTVKDPYVTKKMRTSQIFWLPWKHLFRCRWKRTGILGIMKEAVVTKKKEWKMSFKLKRHSRKMFQTATWLTNFPVIDLLSALQFWDGRSDQEKYKLAAALDVENKLTWPEFWKAPRIW